MLKLYILIRMGCPVTCQVGGEELGDLISSSPRPIHPQERDPLPNVQAADWAPGPVLHMEAVPGC